MGRRGVFRFCFGRTRRRVGEGGAHRVCDRILGPHGTSTTYVIRSPRSGPRPEGRVFGVFSVLDGFLSTLTRRSRMRVDSLERRWLGRRTARGTNQLTWRCARGWPRKPRSARGGLREAAPSAYPTLSQFRRVRFPSLLWTLRLLSMKSGHLRPRRRRVMTRANRPVSCWSRGLTAVTNVVHDGTVRVSARGRSPPDVAGPTGIMGPKGTRRAPGTSRVCSRPVG